MRGKRSVVALCLQIGILGAVAPLQSQDVGRSTTQTQDLSSLAALEGSWTAHGDGFSSQLVYEWALPAVLLCARNELRDDAGLVVGRYEGHYMWDPSESRIVFWTVGQDGELHRGMATWRDGMLWHEATVSGGRIAGYRSVLSLAERELRFRARYERSATDEDVLASPPLTYRPIER